MAKSSGTESRGSGVRRNGLMLGAVFVLLLLAAGIGLHATWAPVPFAEAAQPNPSPQPKTNPTPSPGPTPRPPTPPPPPPGPAPGGGTLMNAGGPGVGPVPLMANGECPAEFPVRNGGSCSAA